jgi:hypothetical protein
MLNHCALSYAVTIAIDFLAGFESSRTSISNTINFQYRPLFDAQQLFSTILRQPCLRGAKYATDIPVASDTPIQNLLNNAIFKIWTKPVNLKSLIPSSAKRTKTFGER